MSDHIEWLIGGIVALAGLLAAIKAIAIPIGKAVKYFATMARHQKETWMLTLKIMIWMEGLPLDDRVDAGIKYVDNKGNGKTGAKHLQNLAELERRVKNNE